MIEKQSIERIKATVDLLALARERGIKMKKNGRSWLGRCPFHNDKTPSFSVTPSKNLWHCFGCDQGGDVIRFVELFDRVDFTEAVKRLIDSDFKPTASRSAPEKAPEPLSVKERRLLADVVDHYQYSLSDDLRGVNYLKKERGITDSQSIVDFETGYANGTLLDILPHDPEVIETLKKIGILNAGGREVFYNCVVFPLLNSQGHIEGLYGRKIDPSAPNKGSVKHLYLPGPRRGIVNRRAVGNAQTVILTESVIDALTLYDQGFRNVIPIYGVNGLIEDHLKLMHTSVKTAYLVFDADEAGKRAVDAVSLRLKEKGIESIAVTLPVKDVNIYFKRYTFEQFEQLLKDADPASLQQSGRLDKRAQELYTQTEHGFITGFDGRQYEVKGIERATTQLKVTVKASEDVAGSKPFELTTIDLYSFRSRVWFAKLCADLFNADEALVKEDMGKLLNLVEQYQPRQKQPSTVEPTRAEKQAAMAFLKNPGLFDEILADLETLGVVGETTNKIVSYLAAISRKLTKPLSVLVQSRSSAGKSTLQNAILSLVPDEEYEKYTRVTDQALFYKEEDSLVHKILAIEEDAGVGGAAYSIRNIQSAGKITVAATGKDPGSGKMKTEQYTVKGPVSVMLTTTAAEIDQETASRFISLSIDESSKMTRAIHAKQRQARTLQGLVRRTKAHAAIAKHHTAQRLLRPVAVVNNFDQYLSYPSGNLITRRDHDKYLGLIEAVAYLHQYQRKTKTVNVDGKPIEYVEVTLEDIDTANRLADEVLGQSLDELPKPSRTLLDAVYKMVKQMAEKSNVSVEDVHFNRRMIREYIGWTDWQIRKHIKQIEDLEYVYVRVGARGKEYSYAMNYNGRGGQSGKCYLNLTPVEQIKKELRGAKGQLRG